MDYYKKRKFATGKIKRLLKAEAPIDRIVLIIQEEYGLSRKFVEETHDLIIKAEITLE